MLSKEHLGKIWQILLLVVLLLVTIFSCWRLVKLQDAVTNLCDASGPEQPLIDCPLWADQLVNLVREIYSANRGIIPFMVGAVILTIIAIVATSLLDMKRFAGCFGDEYR